MIELNCSYEESKKILELGYDFSKVGDMSWVKIGADDVPVLACNNSSIQWLLSDKQLYDFQIAKTKEQPTETIPIIPKAALEACLPDYILKKGCNLFYHVRKFMGELYWVNSRDESLTENWFSPYEAFLWCHEHYPEELKRKFDEVMG